MKHFWKKSAGTSFRLFTIGTGFCLYDPGTFACHSCWPGERDAQQPIVFCLICRKHVLVSCQSPSSQLPVRLSKSRETWMAHRQSNARGRRVGTALGRHNVCGTVRVCVRTCPWACASQRLALSHRERRRLLTRPKKPPESPCKGCNTIISLVSGGNLSQMVWAGRPSKTSVEHGSRSAGRWRRRGRPAAHAGRQ